MSTQLTRIEHLRILKSYGIKNDAAWILRDWIQNFFDAAKKSGSKNPIKDVSVQYSADGKEIRIYGNRFFDLSYLLYMGATDKAGDSSQIGEKGEGLKVSTLLAMRDYEFDITYTSSCNKKSWEAHGLFVPTKIGENSDEELCFEVEEQGPSLLEQTQLIVRGSVANIAKFKALNWKAWFASDENEFLLPKNKLTEMIYRIPNGYENGRTFLAGLDRGDDYRLSFVYRIDQKLSSDSDRDRKVLSNQALFDSIKMALSIDRLPPEVYTVIIKNKINEIIKYHTNDSEALAIRSSKYFLHYFVDVFGSRIRKIFTFSHDKPYDEDDFLTLQRLGVKKVCLPKLREFLISQNVTSIEQLMDGLNKSAELDSPKQEYKNKIEILMLAVQSARLEALPIRVFRANKADKGILGTYNETYVRLSTDVFAMTFGEALSIYIHELAHHAGTDDSAAFSDELTDYAGVMLGSKHNVFGQVMHFESMAELCRRWERYNKNRN